MAMTPEEEWARTNAIFNKYAPELLTKARVLVAEGASPENLVALIIDAVASRRGKVFADVVRASEARAVVEREQLDSWMDSFHSKGDFFTETLAKRDGRGIFVVLISFAIDDDGRKMPHLIHQTLIPVSSAGGTA